MTVLDFIKLYACTSDTAEVRVITGEEMEKFIYSDFYAPETLEDYAGLLAKKFTHFDIMEYNTLVVYAE